MQQKRTANLLPHRVALRVRMALIEETRREKVDLVLQLQRQVAETTVGEHANTHMLSVKLRKLCAAQELLHPGNLLRNASKERRTPYDPSARSANREQLDRVEMRHLGRVKERLQDQIAGALAHQLGVVRQKYEKVRAERLLDTLRGPGTSLIGAGGPVKVQRRPQQRHEERRVVQEIGQVRFADGNQCASK